MKSEQEASETLLQGNLGGQYLYRDLMQEKLMLLVLLLYCLTIIFIMAQSVEYFIV